MKRQSILYLIILAFFLKNIIAQSGSLDPNFGNNGIVVTEIGSDDDAIQSILLQTDGKIIAAGYAFSNGHDNFAIIRYNTDGRIDNTFGSDGIVLTSFSQDDEQIFLDDAQINDIVNTNEEQFIAAGNFYNGENTDVALAKYNNDGSLDSLFGNNGLVITPIGSGNDYCNSIEIQDDSKIIVSGYYSLEGRYDFFLVRFKDDGSLDSNFGLNGIVTTSITINDTIYKGIAQDIAIQQDGKIVVVGYAYNDNTPAFYVISRYFSNGVLDPSFGNNGIVISNISTSDDRLFSVKIQPNNKIVCAGDSYFQSSFSLVRYNTDGTLDSSFDEDGIVITDVGVSYEAATSLVLQQDNKLVAIGSARNSNNFDIAIARYNIDGTLDNTFGEGGIVITPVNDWHDNAKTAVIQSNGYIIIGGFTNDTETLDFDFLLARYISDFELNNKDILITNKLKIYPNPVQNLLYVNSSISENSPVLIYSIDGVLVTVDSLFNNSMNVSNLKTGIYIMTIIDSEKVLTSKFIKE